jgi:hypothetical protein
MLGMLGMLGRCVNKINTLVLILVFTVSLAANSSLLGTYYLGGDDYCQFDKSIADWFATRGIWRIVGIPLPGWLVSGDVYAFALIAAHAIGGYFFFFSSPGAALAQSPTLCSSQLSSWPFPGGTRQWFGRQLQVTCLPAVFSG